MSRRKRLRWRLTDLRDGIKYGYPLCCVLRFAFCRYDYQAVRRGGIDRWRSDGSPKAWVPCNIFHRGEPYDGTCVRWDDSAGDYVDASDTRYGMAR